MLSMTAVVSVVRHFRRPPVHVCFRRGRFEHDRQQGVEETDLLLRSTAHQSTWVGSSGRFPFLVNFFFFFEK